MLYVLLKTVFTLIFRIIFQFHVFGRDYIPKKGGFILASNHLSYLDPLVLGIASPRRLDFMAKRELFRSPFFCWFIFKLGAFSVRRDTVDLSALKEAMQRIKKGRALVLFPEGSRGSDGKSSEPYPGVGFLTAKLEVPVIPAFISGTERALPKGAKFIRFTKISVRFGKQIPIERRMPYQGIAQQVMENIRHLSEDIPPSCILQECRGDLSELTPHL